MGYDNFHPNGERVFRITVESEVLSSGKKQKGALSPILWAPTLNSEYPEIETTTRLVKSESPKIIESNNVRVLQKDIYYAEPTVFDIFGWDIISGDSKKILRNPNEVVLNLSVAKKLFGQENAIGKTIFFIEQSRDDDGKLKEIKTPFKVTAIINDILPKTHMKPKMLISFLQLNEIFGGDVYAGNHSNPDFWRWTLAYTYLKLKPGVRYLDLEKKLPDFCKKHIGNANISRGFKYNVFLQNIRGIHLEKGVHSLPESGTDVDNLYMFSIIAFFVMIIACFNFVVLSTAYAGYRSMEIGVRKVLGAKKREIFFQFISESIVYSLIAFLLALILQFFIHPVFEHYIGKEIILHSEDRILYIVGLFTIILLVGVFAGGYPAIFLSNFRPTNLLKRVFLTGEKGSIVKKGLIVFQFSVTVFFLIGTLIVKQQLSYMKKQDLGFNDEHILVIPNYKNSPFQKHLNLFKDKIKQSPSISNITLSTVIPGQVYARDLWIKEIEPTKNTTVLYEVETDYDFIDTYNLEIIAGREFLETMVTDRKVGIENRIEYSLGYLERNKKNTNSSYKEISVILNEKAISELGFNSPENALGKKIIRDPISVDFFGKVIGVVKDFNFASLKEEIEPLVIYLHDPSSLYPLNTSIKLSVSNINESIKNIEGNWHELFPDSPFNFYFIDENFGSLYNEDEKIFEIFGYISIVSIIICSMGLFGLVLYSVERRKKEFGIRKVLGAKTSSLVFLLSKELVALIIVSNIIAWPAAFIIMNKWLENFAYRTDLNIWLFLISTAIAFCVALLTVSYHSIKVLRLNPLKTIKYE